MRELGQPTAETRANAGRDALEVWAGIYDGLTAIQAEQLGYDALWLSSLGLSVGRLGLPDAGFLRPATVVDAIREITNVVRLPLVVDFENGYGLRGTELAELADEFFSAGGSALCMEDSVGEKRNSLWSAHKRELAAPDDTVARLTTLIDVASRHGGSVVARTEALIEGLGVDAAVERVARYADAGCGAVVVHFRTDPEEVLEVARQVRATSDIRLVVIPTVVPAKYFADFAEAGFNVYVAANVALRAAAAAVGQGLASVLRTGRQQEAVESIASLADLDALVRTDALVPSVTP